MGLRNQLSEPLTESQPSIDVGIGYWESAATAFSLAQRDTALLHTMKQLGRFQLEEEDSPIIDPERANKLAPNLPKPITEPIKLSVLQDIIAENDIQTSLRLNLALGPQDLLSTSMQFGASLLAHALDPFEFAAGALMTPLAGAIGGRMVASSIAGRLPIGLGRAGVALARSDRATFTRLASEGLAGNLAVEPFLLAGTLEDHQDANIYDSFVSVVGGSLGFAAAMRAFASAPRYVAGFGASANESFLRISTGRNMLGKKVNSKKMADAMVEEATHGAPRADTEVKGIVSRLDDSNILDMEHKHDPYNGDLFPAQVVAKTKQKRWFIPSRGKSNKLQGFEINSGKHLGSGITLTDNPVIANGYASHSMNKNPGTVHEVKVDAVSQVTDIDNVKVKRRSEERKRLEGGLKDIGFNKTEVQQVVKGDPTWTQVLERVKDLVRSGKLKKVRLDNLEDRLIELVPGDAVKYETSSTLGVRHQPQNNLFIKRSTLERLGKKGKSAFTQVDRYDSDPQFNKRPTKEELRELGEDYLNRETDRYYDAEAVQEYNKRSLNPTEDPLIAEVDEIYRANKETVDTLAEVEELTANEMLVKEQLDGIEEAHVKEMEITKDAFGCRLGE